MAQQQASPAASKREVLNFVHSSDVKIVMEQDRVITEMHAHWNILN
jgi:hypothetical protein